jgi:hypothetical protein
MRCRVGYRRAEPGIDARRDPGVIARLVLDRRARHQERDARRHLRLSACEVTWRPGASCMGEAVLEEARWYRGPQGLISRWPKQLYARGKAARGLDRRAPYSMGENDAIRR